MRERLLLAIAAVFYYSGLVKLAGWWKRRMGAPNLVILNYHRASDNMKQHMRYLRRHYRVLHLEDALTELFDPADHKKNRSDRRLPLVITLDDGYYDNYSNAFKLATELQVPITIFLIPGYIENGQRFWWYEPEQLLAQACVHEVVIDEQTYHLDNAAERKVLEQLIDKRVRRASSVVERETFLAWIRQALDEPPLVTAAEKPALPMTWEEVLEMDRSDWVSFGAHTMHHPILAYLADPAEASYEVCESRAVLEQKLGHPVRTFAYPVGWLDHIGLQGVKAAHEAAFCWAVTTVYGFNTAQDDPYLLRRIEADTDEHWLLLAAKASGVWFFFTGLVRTLLASLRNPFKRRHLVLRL